MHTEQLTEAQQGELKTIEAEEVSEDQQRRMSNAIERFGYTTTALRAMAAWLESVDDCKGAGMVLAWAHEMARHEAVTL